LLVEMASGEPPWGHFDNPMAAMIKIARSEEIPAIPDHLSESAKDFILRCLQRDMKERPYCEGLLEHPFVQE
jgi:serine/threonine protein kinase